MPQNACLAWVHGLARAGRRTRPVDYTLEDEPVGVTLLEASRTRGHAVQSTSDVLREECLVKKQGLTSGQLCEDSGAGSLGRSASRSLDDALQKSELRKDEAEPYAVAAAAADADDDHDDDDDDMTRFDGSPICRVVHFRFGGENVPRVRDVEVSAAILQHLAALPTLRAELAETPRQSEPDAGPDF